MNEIIAVFENKQFITKRIVYATTEYPLFYGHGLVSNIRTHARLHYGNYEFKSYDGIISTKWVYKTNTELSDDGYLNARIIENNTTWRCPYTITKELFDKMNVTELPFMRDCWVIYNEQCVWPDQLLWVYDEYGVYKKPEPKSVVYDLYEMWFTTKKDHKYNRDIKKQIDVHVVNDIANIIMSYLIIIPVVGNKFFCERQQDEMNYHHQFS